MLVEEVEVQVRRVLMQLMALVETVELEQLTA
jgi:hypothetical protein